MSDRILAATRKGLFVIEKNGGTGQWEIARVHFLADNISIVCHDPRDGTMYAAADHGHFGAKLHRSGNGGEVGGDTWKARVSPEDRHSRLRLGFNCSGRRCVSVVYPSVVTSRSRR